MPLPGKDEDEAFFANDEEDDEDEDADFFGPDPEDAPARSPLRWVRPKNWRIAQ